MGNSQPSGFIRHSRGFSSALPKMISPRGSGGRPEGSALFDAASDRPTLRTQGLRRTWALRKLFKFVHWLLEFSVTRGQFQPKGT